MAQRIICMFLSNYPYDNGFVRYPRVDTFKDAESGNFPMLWIFQASNVGDMDYVPKIKRTTWLKYENGEKYRYYQEYMKLFETEKETSKKFKVGIHLISENCESEKELMDVVKKYRVIYGNKVLLSLEYKNYICPPPPPPEPVPPEPTPSPEERRRQSRKKYEDSIREKLREKCRKYYSLNKERLREKRLAKTQNVGNQNVLITGNNL